LCGHFRNDAKRKCPTGLVPCNEQLPGRSPTTASLFVPTTTTTAAADITTTAAVTTTKIAATSCTKADGVDCDGNAEYCASHFDIVKQATLARCPHLCGMCTSPPTVPPDVLATEDDDLIGEQPDGYGDDDDVNNKDADDADQANTPSPTAASTDIAATLTQLTEVPTTAPTAASSSILTTTAAILTMTTVPTSTVPVKTTQMASKAPAQITVPTSTVLAKTTQMASKAPAQITVPTSTVPVKTTQMASKAPARILTTQTPPITTAVPMASATIVPSTRIQGLDANITTAITSTITTPALRLPSATRTIVADPTTIVTATPTRPTGNDGSGTITDGGSGSFDYPPTITMGANNAPDGNQEWSNPLSNSVTTFEETSPVQDSTNATVDNSKFFFLAFLALAVLPLVAFVRHRSSNKAAAGQQQNGTPALSGSGREAWGAASNRSPTLLVVSASIPIPEHQQFATHTAYMNVDTEQLWDGYEPGINSMDSGLLLPRRGQYARHGNR
jgi:hypothetical protein